MIIFFLKHAQHKRTSFPLPLEPPKLSRWLFPLSKESWLVREQEEIELFGSYFFFSLPFSRNELPCPRSGCVRCWFDCSSRQVCNLRGYLQGLLVAKLHVFFFNCCGKGHSRPMWGPFEGFSENFVVVFCVLTFCERESWPTPTRRSCRLISFMTHTAACLTRMPVSPWTTRFAFVFLFVLKARNFGWF